MISLTSEMNEFDPIPILPTMFPDGTSQVWKLPDRIFGSKEVRVIWNFEKESELIYLASLRKLLGETRRVTLHVPYLPYARQDKAIDNEQTFNLIVFAGLLNQIGFDVVSTVDVHSSAAKTYIKNLVNLEVGWIHQSLVRDLKPDYIVYPDIGARDRYKIRHPKRLIFYKHRDQLTGEITGHEISMRDSDCGFTIHSKEPNFVQDRDRFLIVDDICDGGATFLSIVKTLRTSWKIIYVDLFVTHGIFSKGRQILTDQGINIYTTNSLSKNSDGYEV